MIINDKILSIPPYISTAWNSIASLTIQEKEMRIFLIVGLKNGSIIEVPDLGKSIIDAIFDMHAKFLDNEKLESFSSNPTTPSKEDFLSLGFPLKSGMGNLGNLGNLGSIENLGNAMQHTPEQKNAPDLPKEILKKISSIARVLGMDDPYSLPKPEPHCNCFHCQIAKTLQTSIGILEENLDEEVNDNDLKFRSWDIKQMSDNLYEVINPLDGKEQYNVYLGNPVGCTCGKKNCEHIKAVLNT